MNQLNALSNRVEYYGRTYKGNGLWDHLASFAYGDPKQFAELQTADMIAHETFQCLREGLEGGWAWNKWPLVKNLLERDRPMHGGHQTEEQFVKMLLEQDRNGRRYLKTVEKPKKG